MKKILFAFLTFGMLIGLASCEKELTGDDKDKENQGSVESVQLEVKGRILTDGDKASKVTGELELVQGEKESVKLVPSWQVGDEICGFVDGKVSTTLRFKVNSIVDGTALFSWSGEGNVPELNTGTKVHVLYFPFSSVPTNGEFKVDYSDVDGTLESALKHAVLCADGVVTSDEGSGKRYLDLDFENMMSIFRVYGLKYPDDTPVPAGATISVSAERGFTDHATVKFNTNVTPNKFQFYLDKTCYTSALNLTLKTAKIYEKGEGGSYEEVEVPCAYFVLPASDKWNTNDWNPAWRGWNNGQTSETSAPFTGITEFFVVVKGKDGKELYYAKAGEGDTQKIDKKVEANKLYNVAKGMKTKENGYDDYEFAPGNLQYRKIKVGDEWKDQWRFAQNSFDIIGGYSNQGMYEGNVFEEDGTRYDNTKIVDYYGGWSSHVQIQSDRTYCYVPQDSLEAIKASGKIVYSSSFPNEYYQGWMDLFAFGTSGYEKTLPYAVYNGSYTPMYHTIEDMYARENLYNAEGPTYYDWGHYLDGKDGRPGIEGDMYPGEWMTLNWDEWYIILTRETEMLGYSAKQGFATIYDNDTNMKKVIARGMVLLPDAFIDPKTNFNVSNAQYKDGSFLPKAIFKAENSYERNQYTLEGWSKMEAAGAAFFPAAGDLVGSPQYRTQESGYRFGKYATSDIDTRDKTKTNSLKVVFSGAVVTSAHIDEYRIGCSVRLARPINDRLPFYVKQ